MNININNLGVKGILAIIILGTILFVFLYAKIEQIFIEKDYKYHYSKLEIGQDLDSIKTTLKNDGILIFDSEIDNKQRKIIVFKDKLCVIECVFDNNKLISKIIKKEES